MDFLKIISEIFILKRLIKLILPKSQIDIYKLFTLLSLLLMG